MPKTATRAPYQPGDTIRAMYLDRDGVTALGVAKVERVIPRDAGGWRVYGQDPTGTTNFWTVNDRGVSDYVAGLALDARDNEIREARTATLAAVQGPRVGDFVRFADGVERRISHVWTDEGGPFSIQTSDLHAGSYYLGNGYASFSGGLHPGMDPATFTEVPGEVRAGTVWFFHHDRACAHNGVDTTIPFRAYACSEPAN